MAEDQYDIDDPPVKKAKLVKSFGEETTTAVPKAATQVSDFGEEVTTEHIKKNETLPTTGKDLQAGAENTSPSKSKSLLGGDFLTSNVEDYNRRFEDITGHKGFDLSEPVKSDSLLGNEGYEKKKKVVEQRKFQKNRDIEENEFKPVLSNTHYGFTTPQQLSELYNKPYGKKVVETLIKNEFSIPQEESVSPSDWEGIALSINKKNRVNYKNEVAAKELNQDNIISGIKPGVYEREELNARGDTKEYVKIDIPSIDNNNPSSLGVAINSFKKILNDGSKEYNGVDIAKTILPSLEFKLGQLNRVKKIGEDVSNLDDNIYWAIDKIEGEYFSYTNTEKDARQANTDDRKLQAIKRGIEYYRDADPALFKKAMMTIAAKKEMADSDYARLLMKGQELENDNIMVGAADDPSLIGKETAFVPQLKSELKSRQSALIGETVKQTPFLRGKIELSDKDIDFAIENTNWEAAGVPKPTKAAAEVIKVNEDKWFYDEIPKSGLGHSAISGIEPLYAIARSLEDFAGIIKGDDAGNYLRSKQLDRPTGMAQLVMDEKGELAKELPSDRGNVFFEIMKGTTSFIIQMGLTRGLGGPIASIAKTGFAAAPQALLGSAKTLNTISNVAGTGISSWFQAFGDAYERTLDKTGDPIRAEVIGNIEGAIAFGTEQFLLETKVASKIFKNLTGDVSDNIYKIVRSKLDPAEKIKQISGKLKAFAQSSGDVIARENFEEVSGVLLSRMAQAIVTPEVTEDRSLLNEIGQTIHGTSLSLFLPAIASGGAAAKNRFTKKVFNSASLNLEYTESVLKKQLMEGTASQDEYNQAISLLTTNKNNIVSAPKTSIDGKGLDKEKRQEYGFQQTIVQLNEEKAKKAAENSDEPQVKIFKEKVKEARDIQNKILDRESVNTFTEVANNPEIKAINDKWKQNIISIGEMSDEDIAAQHFNKEEYKTWADAEIEDPEAASNMIAEKREQLKQGEDSRHAQEIADLQKQEIEKPLSTTNEESILKNKKIESAVIEIGGKTYEGKNHAEAILKAKEDGQDISQVDRKADGKFKLSDGTIIDRAEAKQKFGQDRSELLIEQDVAADQANKDYRKITDATEKTLNLQNEELSRQLPDTLSQTEKQGSIAGGETNAAATAIVGAIQKTSGTASEGGKKLSTEVVRSQEETELKKYAEENGLLIENSFGEPHEFGTEQDVYINPDGISVTKINNNPTHDTWNDFFHRIAIHNSLFPDVPYTLKGFSERDGLFSVVLEQPLITKGEEVKLSEIKEELSKMGFEQAGGKYTFENKKTGVILTDLHGENVIKGTDGKLHFIDPIIHTEEGRVVDQPQSPPSSNTPKEEVVSADVPLVKEGGGGVISGGKVWEDAKKDGSETGGDFSDMEFIIKGSDYVKAEIPIDKLIENDEQLREFLKTEPAKEKGRKITQPIIVTNIPIGDEIQVDGIADGFNRVAQAVANGDKTIIAYVQSKSELIKGSQSTKPNTKEQWVDKLKTYPESIHFVLADLYKTTENKNEIAKKVSEAFKEDTPFNKSARGSMIASLMQLNIGIVDPSVEKLERQIQKWVDGEIKNDKFLEKQNTNTKEQVGSGGQGKGGDEIVEVSMPKGWKKRIGYISKDGGKIPEGEVDWQNKQIMFSTEENANNPEIVNHEIAHIIVETTLPDEMQEKFYKDYSEVKKDEYKRLGVENTFYIKQRGYDPEGLSVDFGEYLNGKLKDEPLKKLFKEYFGVSPNEQKTKPQTTPSNLPKGEEQKDEREVTHGVIGRVGKFVSRVFGGKASEKVFVAKDEKSLIDKANELQEDGGDVKYLFKEAVIGAVAMLQPMKMSQSKAVRTEQTSRFQSKDERKVIDILNNYYKENNETPPQEVIDRALYLWDKFGRPEIFPDSTSKDERAFATNEGGKIKIGNITNFDDFVAELSHTAQYVSGKEMDNRRYPTQELKDRVEYNRKGSMEYKAHTIIEPILAKYIFSGDSTELNKIQYHKKEGNILGFTHNGKIYLNGENLNPETPIHEAGHIWTEWTKQNDSKLYNKGIELINGSNYLKSIKGDKFYQSEANKLSEKEREQYFQHEALAQAIGDKGAKFVSDSKKTGFKEWLNNLWTNIKNVAGFKDLSNKEFQNLTLDEFSKRAAKDILNEPSTISQDNSINKQSNLSTEKRSSTNEVVGDLPQNSADKLQSKPVGKYEQKAMKLAEKIDKAELPSWLRADLPEGTQTQGASTDQLKKALANATIQMGKLLDKGVEFSQAVKQAVKELVDLLGEENRDAIEKGFEKYYNDEVAKSAKDEIKEKRKEAIALRKALKDIDIYARSGLEKDQVEEIFKKQNLLTPKVRVLIDKIYDRLEQTEGTKQNEKKKEESKVAEGKKILDEIFAKIKSGQKVPKVFVRLTTSDAADLIPYLKGKYSTYKGVSLDQLEEVADSLIEIFGLDVARDMIKDLDMNEKPIAMAKVAMKLREEGRNEDAAKVMADLIQTGTAAGQTVKSFDRVKNILGSVTDPTFRTEFQKAMYERMQSERKAAEAEFNIQSETFKEKISDLEKQLHEKTVNDNKSLLSKLVDKICGARKRK